MDYAVLLAKPSKPMGHAVHPAVQMVATQMLTSMFTTNTARSSTQSGSNANNASMVVPLREALTVANDSVILFYTISYQVNNKHLSTGCYLIIKCSFL